MCCLIFDTYPNRITHYSISSQKCQSYPTILAKIVIPIIENPKTGFQQIQLFQQLDIVQSVIQIFLY